VQLPHRARAVSPRRERQGDAPAPTSDGRVLTLLDTTETSCTHPADPTWAHDFRHRVAAKLRPLLSKKARRLGDCGERPIVMVCEGCTTPHLFPERCKARTCPTCAHRTAGAVAGRLLERIRAHDVVMESQPWDGTGLAQRRSWRLVTLTSPAPSDVEVRWDPTALRDAVKSVGDALARWWRMTPWGRQVRDQSRSKRARADTSAVGAQEIAPGGMVHWHVMVYGEFVPQDTLAAAWASALGVPAAIVDVRTIRGDISDGIREALKYATKGTGEDQVARASAVEYALHNVKRIRTYGALRGILGRSPEPDDDGTSEDVHDHHEAACEACGLVGEWRWTRSRAGNELVARNQGWGRVQPSLSRAPPGGSVRQST